MTVFPAHCRPAAIGSLPHADPAIACDLVLRYLPEIPMWPQLPGRSQCENMYVQYFGRFPGASIEGDKVRVARNGRLDAELETLYADYLAGNSARYALDPELAAGFALMTTRWVDLPRRPLAVKGQVTGPISAGLQITDQELRPLLYDQVLADALGRYLRLVAREQERALERAGAPTITFVDEPYLSAIGSGFIPIDRTVAAALLAEVLGGLRGLKGIHCCGNTDWSLVLETNLDVLSFDAFDYAETLALYGSELKGFIARGGILAWGIVPTEPAALGQAEAKGLVDRLLGSIDLLAGKGLSREAIVNQSLITPSCGLAPLGPDEAVRALALTAEVSDRLRRRFFEKES